MAKSSYRYVKKRYQKFYIKTICGVCEQGFKIGKHSGKMKGKNNDAIDQLFEGYCLGGHDLCRDCVDGGDGGSYCENHLI